MFLCTPKFNDLYPPMIFQNAYFRIRVNFWFVLHRLEKVASKLVHELLAVLVDDYLSLDKRVT